MAILAQNSMSSSGSIGVHRTNSPEMNSLVFFWYLCKMGKKWLQFVGLHRSDLSLGCTEVTKLIELGAVGKFENEHEILRLFSACSCLRDQLQLGVFSYR